MVDRQATSSRSNSRRSSSNTSNNSSSSNSKPHLVLGCSVAWTHPAPPSDQGGGAAMWPWERTWLPVQPLVEHSQPDLAASITSISRKRQPLLIWQQRWMDWLVRAMEFWSLSKSTKCKVDVGNTADCFDSSRGYPVWRNVEHLVGLGTIACWLECGDVPCSFFRSHILKLPPEN
jgi:hypothetical protein